MLVVVHKRQRWIALGFLVSSMIMMRLMIELIESTGFPGGILPFLSVNQFSRGLGTYSIFYLAYAILAHYSPDTDNSIFLSGSIGMFFTAAFVFALVMVL